jgi:hypothetical protein
MKLAVNVGLSLAMLALCAWLVWPSPAHRADIQRAFESLEWRSFWPYLAAYLGLLAATHFFRAWRWNNLLHPIGVRLSPGRLLAISSVGFMAILALPARLGEFVRPALIRRRGQVSAVAALGTVAVERIVDGLLVSIVVFAAFFVLRGSAAPGWMMPTAYTALGVFLAATAFLALALRWPRRTIDTILTLSLARALAPRIARFLDEKLLARQRDRHPGPRAWVRDRAVVRRCARHHGVDRGRHHAAQRPLARRSVPGVHGPGAEPVRRQRCREHARAAVRDRVPRHPGDLVRRLRHVVAGHPLRLVRRSCRLAESRGRWRG